MTIEDAARAVDLPTLALLFALMVFSVQLRLGGFYGRVAELVTRGGLDPPRVLLAVVLLVGVLAAVSTNDIVSLAVGAGSDRRLWAPRARPETHQRLSPAC